MFENMNQNPFMMSDQDTMIDIDNNSGNIDIDVTQGQSLSNGPMNFGGQGMVTTQTPIIEPMRERVVNRTFEHIVPHVCPMRTKIINHHIYKHTYRPAYSCCEENVCSEVQCGSCCNFN